MVNRLPFELVHTALRAAAEGTRLRILALLTQAELTVSDLTEILRQSQPRISRHLKLLSEAGLIERHREGAWAFFRVADQEGGAEMVRLLSEYLDPDDPVLSARPRKARRRAPGARDSRAGLFQRACRAMGSHPQAARRRRRGGGGDRARRSADKPIRSLLDLGTGTGRMLELFGPSIERGLGIDLSPDMLLLARARLDRAGLQALQRAPGRHLQSGAAARILRRRHRPSGAALSRRRRARDPRSRARAHAVRPADGGRFRAA